jgi:hypothetical protein
VGTDLSAGIQPQRIRSFCIFSRLGSHSRHVERLFFKGCGDIKPSTTLVKKGGYNSVKLTGFYQDFLIVDLVPTLLGKSCVYNGGFAVRDGIPDYGKTPHG